MTDMTNINLGKCIANAQFIAILTILFITELMCVPSVCMDIGLSKQKMGRFIAKKRGPLASQMRMKELDFQTLTKLAEVDINVCFKLEFFN